MYVPIYMLLGGYMCHKGAPVWLEPSKEGELEHVPLLLK